MAAEERQAAQADEIDRLLRDAIALVVGEGEDGKNTAQPPEAADEKNPNDAAASVSSHRDELVGILEQVRVLARARTTEVQQLQRWLGQGLVLRGGSPFLKALLVAAGLERNEGSGP